MKALVIALLTLAATLTDVARAQTPAIAGSPPEIEVVKFGWSKERVGWERDPFGGPIENFDEMRVRARNERRILDAKRGGNTGEVDRIEREARADAANIAKLRDEKGPPRYGFMYKASVKNNSAKAIKSIDWDYIFLDAATGAELGRHQFTNDVKIGPGKSKELQVFISRPPTQTVSAYVLNNKERLGLGERILLVRIVYVDGTSWERR